MHPAHLKLKTYPDTAPSKNGERANICFAYPPDLPIAYSLPTPLSPDILSPIRCAPMGPGLGQGL